MSHFATENVRIKGRYYAIGDAVPDDIAALLAPDAVELREPGQSEQDEEAPATDLPASADAEPPAIETVDMSVDDYAALMMGEIAKFEGLELIPATKALIAQALFDHYCDVGLIKSALPEAQPPLAPAEIGQAPASGLLADLRDERAPVSLSTSKPRLLQIAAEEGAIVGEAAGKAEIIAAIEARRAEQSAA